MNHTNLEVVTVNLDERIYPILIGNDLLSYLGEAVNEHLLGITECVVVMQPTVRALYGERIMASLDSLNPDEVLMPEGEEAKTWGSVSDLLGALFKLGLDRRGIIVAFGGGSIGDSAGFAASIYMRGVRIVQVPTTLLGQIDSSIGGKTAVNHVTGKNLIGSFHQPSLVACDTDLLASLPKREISSGLAEVMKYGVIADSALFTVLEDEVERLLSADSEAMRLVVTLCVSAKVKKVEVDERDDRGVRVSLNYGHTVGHAIETLSSHEIRHGEAVAIGMMAASRVALSFGLLTQSELKRQRELLTTLGLPTESPFDASEILPLIKWDKKSERGSIRLILPTGIGSTPVLRSVSEDDIRSALGV